MTEADLAQHPIIRSMREGIIRKPRRWKRVVMILIDCALLLLAIWASYALRLSNWSPGDHQERLILPFSPSPSRFRSLSGSVCTVGDPLSAGGRDLDRPAGHDDRHHVLGHLSSFLTEMTGQGDRAALGPGSLFRARHPADRQHALSPPNGS